MIRAAVVAVLLLLALPARATDLTSIEAYMPYCRLAVADISDTRAAPCVYYAAGFNGVFSSGVLNWPACPPQGVTAAEIIREFVVWADAHPDLWGEKFFRGLIATVTARYPC